MLLGIALHGSVPYFSRIAGFEFMWPADEDQSTSLAIMFYFIHTWRMPTFFLLAGFFAHLILDRHSLRQFAVGRMKRIGIPLIVFGVIMASILPPIWHYGWSGNLSLDIFRGMQPQHQDLDSSGSLIAHLWFLYYLLLIYAMLVTFRLWQRCSTSWTKQLFASRILPKKQLSDIIYGRFPLVLILGATVLLVIRAGDESKPIWPLNMPDLLYAALFFFYGYGLYLRRGLIERLRDKKTLVVLWTFAWILFLISLALTGELNTLSKQNATDQAITIIQRQQWVFYGASSVLFTLGFVGLFERLCSSPRAWIRWVADSSYWIYIMHLPVVAFLGFYLAHLDTQGWLKYLTAFSWNAELKFVFVCTVTGVVGFGTYRYLVRYTPLGTLLHGKRSKL
ncbi:acyltransferase family protein [Dehalococcoidia bacterium]|nr:acyltransferase family protein [Dehalococcoidia bacterium]